MMITRLKNFHSFNESNKSLTFKQKVWAFQNLNIDFSCYVDTNLVGESIVDILIKEDSFDDSKDLIFNSKNIEGSTIANIKKNLLKHRYLCYISNFEIKDKYRNNGYGYLMIKYIIDYINKKYNKSEGIYLFVDKKNYS